MNTKIIKMAFSLFLFLVCSHANAQIEFVEKYEDCKTATYVYVGKAMLKLVGAEKFSLKGRDMSTIVDKISNIHIITSDDEATVAQLNNDIAETITKNNYDVMMKANEEETKMAIYFLQGKKENYMLITDVEEDETNVIAFTGSFTLEDIAGLAKSGHWTLNIDH